MTTIGSNPDIRIGNSQINVEGVRRLKSDVDGVERLENGDVKVNEDLMKQLGKDGYDEIIFKKGDELFVAYKKNMKLDGIKFNLENATFDPDSAYERGQMSVNGDAVQVLATDDENRESFWVAPYNSAGRLVKSMVNDPHGKTFLNGLIIGGAMYGIGRGLGDASKAFNGTMIGGGAAGVASGLKAGFESGPSFGGVLGGIAATAAGVGIGAATTFGLHELGIAAVQNPKVAAITAGATALFVGSGIVLDMMSDDNKPATMRVLNRISE